MAAPVNVGDILAGKYQVERVLGVGGMGVVVAAKHLTLGDRVAIKFLLPSALERADVVSRFLKEGQAAARLRSEHVTRVKDYGKLPSGTPFLVMEYLDGSDLGAVLRKDGPIGVEAAVGYVLQACEALAEAHSFGIVHRDLKPSNLFLIKGVDGSLSIKLIDFGISKISLPNAEGAEGEMTQTAVMMGSPLYMAPEQMASARDVDGRADIWSLGIILHTMLTGTPPFKAPSVMQIYELIMEGAKPIRTLRSDVPEGVEAAILRCLKRDRKERFDDVGQLAEALAAFGPPEARFTADRAKRIVAARPSVASIPPLSDAPIPVVGVTPAPTSATPSLGESKAVESSAPERSSPTSPSTSGASHPTASSVVPDPHATDGPWDQKTRPPTKRRSPLLLVAVGVVALGVPLGFLGLRASSGPAGTPASSGAPQTEVPRPPASAPPAAPASAAPSTGPTVSPSVPATAETQAAPSATATAAARTKRTPPPSPPPPRAPSPQPKQRNGDDLFGTQK